MDTAAETGGKTSTFNMNWQLIIPAEDTEGAEAGEDGAGNAAEAENTAEGGSAQ